MIAALALLLVAETPAPAVVLAAAEAALEGKKAAAMSGFERAALMAPESTALEEAMGAAALLLGDDAKARRILARAPRMAVYNAMALASGTGGRAKAISALAEGAKEADAPPGVYFLAALAFHQSGQAERAQPLLQKAVAAAGGPLDEAFAPDPAVAMVRAVLPMLGEVLDAKPRLAVALLSAQRRAEAMRLAEECLAREETRAAGLRVLVLVENVAEARRALDRVERLLREAPDAPDALVARAVLTLRTGEVDRAQKLVESLPPVDAPELQSELYRVRAEVVLRAKGGDPAKALEDAEQAVRADPKSDEAVAVLVRALLASGKKDRARAVANALLERKPSGVDPFALLALVSEALGEKKRASEMRLRSSAFAAEKRKLEREVTAREQILRAVRESDSAIGGAGLEALRGEQPAFALPIDLALAKRGTPGFARAARERILGSCGPALGRLLERRRGWDFVTLPLSLYGTVTRVDAPLSGPDPARCTR